MLLSENSTFSVLVLLRKDILAFFQESFGFQWLKKQEKRNRKDHNKEESWTWHITLCHHTAPASTALIHVSDHVLPPALSWGWQVSLSTQFYNHLLTGQQHHPELLLKPRLGIWGQRIIKMPSERQTHNKIGMRWVNHSKVSSHKQH